MINRLLIATFLFIIPFAFYIKTLAPTVIWGDSAKIAIFSYKHSLEIRPEHHPLHTISGILFNQLPFHGDIAYHQNVMSAFFGALCVVLFFFIVMKISQSTFSALLSSLILAVSHMFWHLSVIAETYTLCALFVLATILILLIWRESKQNYFIYLFVFIFSLSLSNNVLLIFFVPAYAYFILKTDVTIFLSKRSLFIIFFSFFLGLTPLIFIFIKNFPDSIEAALHFAGGGPFIKYYRSPIKMVVELARYPAYLLYQFPIFSFFLGPIGLIKMTRRKGTAFWLLLLIFIGDVIFASGYMRQKQFYLLLPSFMVFAVWIGVGLMEVAKWVKGFMFKSFEVKPVYSKFCNAAAGALVILLLGTPLTLYYNIDRVVNWLNIDLVGARSLPYRDNNRFFLLPDKSNEYSAYNYGRQVFERVAPNSIIFADFTPIAVLRYFQEVEHIRQDVKLVLVDFEPLDWRYIENNLDTRVIYLADDLEPDYGFSDLTRRYKVVAREPIFQVMKKENKGPMKDEKRLTMETHLGVYSKRSANNISSYIYTF